MEELPLIVDRNDNEFDEVMQILKIDPKLRFPKHLLKLKNFFKDLNFFKTLDNSRSKRYSENLIFLLTDFFYKNRH